MIRKRQQNFKSNRPCYFCESKTIPDYKESALLETYMSERGKIIARIRTGTCSKHHRYLTSEIKKARFLALLPYIVRG
jgi:small subunit ribosomal protein S18